MLGHAEHVDNRRGGGGALAAVTLPESDESLAARAVSDPAATEELFRRYLHRIYAYCARRLADEEMARDATGAILLKAFESLQRSQIARFEAWIFAIAHNEVGNRYRSRKATVALEVAGDLASDELSLEDAIVADLDRRELRALIAGLKPDQRDVVELRLSGLDGREIADALGRSRSWVDTTQYRAVRRLRELMVGTPDREER